MTLTTNQKFTKNISKNMEGQISTIVCPNCGASTSNRHNCEYCGSMLVRFTDHGIQIDPARYGKDARPIPGLESALKNNIILQKAGIESDLPITEIASQNNHYQILPTPEANFNLGIDNPFSNISSIGLTLRIPFLVRSFNSDYASDARYRLAIFQQMDCFDLFTAAEGKEGIYYLLDFGNDYETAARMLTTILNEIEGKASYDCSTYSVEKKMISSDYSGQMTVKKERMSKIGIIINIISISILITAIIYIVLSL